MRQLDKARREAATLGDGLTLKASSVGTEPFANLWLGHDHGEQIESAAPGYGLYATQDFKLGGYVTLYDGDYLEGGFEAACTRADQTHVAHCQHCY
eukprot:705923-Prymnesium_polylepis.1